MGCGCGKKNIQTVSHEAAQTMRLGRAPVYTVTAPDGTSESFDRYIDAVTAKRSRNGVLTTST